ncbi:MAG: hypothetical protein ACI9R3_001631 [Verrucomicrobiales bacterium]|jgi:hypothetical protein
MLKKICRWISGTVVITCWTLTCDAAVSLGNFELTADQEVMVSTSIVTGHGEFSFNDVTNRLMLVLQFTGTIDLDGNQSAATALDDLTGLHIHNGPFGANGGVVFNVLTAPATLVDAVNGRVLSMWEPAAEQVLNLQAGDLYLNAHTTEFPNGAIRGQIVLPKDLTIPEPSTGGLVLLGAFALVAQRRKR